MKEKISKIYNSLKNFFSEKPFLPKRQVCDEGQAKNQSATMTETPEATEAAPKPEEKVEKKSSSEGLVKNDDQLKKQIDKINNFSKNYKNLSAPFLEESILLEITNRHSQETKNKREEIQKIFEKFSKDSVIEAVDEITKNILEKDKKTIDLN